LRASAGAFRDDVAKDFIDVTHSGHARTRQFGSAGDKSKMQVADGSMQEPTASWRVFEIEEERQKHEQCC
jgi:hypothetical protein